MIPILGGILLFCLVGTLVCILLGIGGIAKLVGIVIIIAVILVIIISILEKI